MTERKAGNSRLVYNKATRTIDTVRTLDEAGLVREECAAVADNYADAMRKMLPRFPADSPMQELGTIRIETAEAIAELIRELNGVSATKSHAGHSEAEPGPE